MKITNVLLKISIIHIVLAIISYSIIEKINADLNIYLNFIEYLASINIIMVIIFILIPYIIGYYIISNIENNEKDTNGK